MKRKPVLIVSTTRAKDKQNTLLYKSLHAMSTSNMVVKKQYKLIMHVDNTTPLSKVYNKYLNKRTLEKHDVVLFVHDDVFIDDLGCFDKLYSSLFTYGNDLVGLAGASQVTIKKPALWHLMSDRKHHSGSVAHIDTQNDVMQMTSFGPYPRRCLLLDGLFLAVNLKSILDVDWKFNVQFEFHHYDLASCLDANKLKLKLSTCNIHVVHASPGLEDYYDESYQQSEKKFLHLYAD